MFVDGFRHCSFESDLGTFLKRQPGSIFSRFHHLTP